MKKKSNLLLSLTLLGTLVGIVGSVSTGYSADPQAAVAIPYAPPYISYSAKFNCGPTPTPSTNLYEGQDVVKGMYKTTINIHNPNAVPVRFWKKAVIAYPERNTQRGPISQIKNEALDIDQAMEVDCLDITKYLFAGMALPSHIEGFVVIITQPDVTGGIPRELDVWGKYTARHRTGTGGIPDVSTDVESIDMIQVQPVRVTQ